MLCTKLDTCIFSVVTVSSLRSSPATNGWIPLYHDWPREISIVELRRIWKCRGLTVVKLNILLSDATMSRNSKNGFLGKWHYFGELVSLNTVVQLNVANLHGCMRYGPSYETIIWLASLKCKMFQKQGKSQNKDSFSSENSTTHTLAEPSNLSAHCCSAHGAN